MLKFTYNKKLYPFREIVSKAIKVDHWRHLEHLDDKLPIPEEAGMDQGTRYHKDFYANTDTGSDFHNTYVRFLREVIYYAFADWNDGFPTNLIVQRKPTFRVSLLGNKAVARVHRDSDAPFYHDMNEVNICLPFTDMFGTNSIFIEDSPGSNKLHPMQVNYGEFIMFDAVRHSHGNKLNDSGFSRVSIDFRIIPEFFYKDRDTQTVAAGRKMDLTDYWIKLHDLFAK